MGKLELGGAVVISPFQYCDKKMVDPAFIFVL